MLLKKGEVTVWWHMALDLQPHFPLPGILQADSYYQHGREKETTEDEMIGWHHQLKGPKFEQTQGYSERQGGLVCYSPWSRKESDATTTTMGWGWQAVHRCDTCGNTMFWQCVRWPDLILSIACETMAATGIAEHLRITEESRTRFFPQKKFQILELGNQESSISTPGWLQFFCWILCSSTEVSLQIQRLPRLSSWQWSVRNRCS